MQSSTSRLKRWRDDYSPPPGRAGELFLGTLGQVQARTNNLFFYLLLIQYPAAVAVALIWSPLAWKGSTNSTHFHVWLAIFFGGLLTSLPLYLIRTCPTAPLTRHVLAVAQMLIGAMLIHLSGGRIETHFHVFGSLAFLAFYRDIRVLLTATVIVSLDHLLRGIYIPGSVYGVISTSHWRFVEHAFWVIFENVFLAISCVQGRAQLSAMASQQAQLEEVNERIEAAVKVRTRELAARTEELASARDAAMESTRLKSQFLAKVSHEIRTPMNGVFGMTTLLLDTDLTSDQRDCAMTVQRSAERLLTIINDILDFSRIEAGKLTLEHAEFLLPNEIEDVVNLVSEVARRKGLELICEIDGSVPCLVSGDAGRLRQILVNLIGNAIKFTERGHILVRATARSHTDDGARMRFEVVDTGIGIAESARKNLFESFVQVDGTTTRKHEGTGLGLAISQQLVQIMRGEIGFDSAVGSGSTFWFEIPFETAAPTAIDRNALKGLRILIADDDSGSSGALMEVVRSWGMAAEKAASGEAALKAMESAFERQERFDIALVDLRSPKMDSLEFVRAVRGCLHLHSTKFLLHVPAGWKGVRIPLTHTGIARLMKPAPQEQMFVAIGRLCGRQILASSKSEEEVSLRTIASAGPSPARELSVLVAEDNRVNQRVLTGLLQRLGHRCEVVSDGRAAIEAASKRRYDVVLMDCQMPSVDGFEATAAIRKLANPVGSVPIIAVTANAMIGDRERCIAAGMDGYIAKPIHLDQLVHALGNIECHRAAIHVTG